MLVAVYLAAIVAANLALATFGPAAAIPVGFVLIGLDLTTRDRLHDRWAGRRLPWRMAGLIAAGGAISYALNMSGGQARVAAASTAAFAVAATLDAVVYSRLRGWNPRARSAASNVPAAAADSWLFLELAFPGPAPMLIVLAQFLAKSLGGAVWALVLYRRQRSPRTLDEAIRADLGQ
jgi:hypothetical protein